MNPNLDNLRGRVRAFRDEAIADLALERGLINEAQLAACFDEIEAKGGMLPDVMVRRGHVSPEQLRELRSQRRGAELGEMVAQYAGETPTEIARSGERFGKFILVNEIGQGGMGVVHRAWQTDLGRWVAIKRLRLEGSGSTARFLREARLAARIVHPNMVPIHEVGEIENTPYLAMALIDGGSLEGRKLPIRRALDVILLVARATQELHLAGILHRDIKPGNILVDRADRVYLGDFSLARQDDTPGLSKSGLMVGTPAYAPPEQLRGESAKIGARSDVYSLGATLFSLLTGEFPFNGPDAVAVAYRALESEPPLLREIEPEINRQIQTIVQKAMRKRPDERYASAEEFANDVKRYLDGQTLVAKPPGAWEHLRDRAIRHRVALAVALFVLVVAAGLPFILQHRQREFIDQEVKVAKERMDRLASAKDALERYLRTPSHANGFKDRVDDSRARIDACKTEDPRSMAARVLDARHLARSVSRKAAQRALKEALAIDPAHPEALLLQARISLLLYCHSRNILVFDDGTTVNRRDSEARRVEAMKAVDAVKSDPKMKSAAGLIEGLLAQADGRWQDAVGAFDRHLEGEPMDAEARSARALCLTILNDFHGAEKDAEFLVQNFGDDEFRLLRASIRFHQARYAEALADVDAVDRILVSKWQIKAESHLKLGQLEEALSAIARAVEIDPRDAQLRMERARILRASGRHAEALSELNKAAEFGAPELHVLDVRAGVYFDSGQIENALQDYRRLADNTEGKTRRIWFQNAMVALFKLSEHSAGTEFEVATRGRCIEYATGVIRLDPGCGEAYFFRACARQALQIKNVDPVNRDVLIEDLKNCLANNPRPVIAERAAQLLEKHANR